MADVWKTEGDRFYWNDKVTGYDCAIHRVERSGHLCGYVLIPDESALFGVYYSQEIEIPKGFETDAREYADTRICGHCNVVTHHVSAGCAVSVHGGVTFSDKFDEKGGYLATGFWWGFDAAHSGDLCPNYDHNDSGVYRDVEYMRVECASLALQIKTLSEAMQ